MTSTTTTFSTTGAGTSCPPVRWEPCDAFCAGPAPDEPGPQDRLVDQLEGGLEVGLCAACGWPADDHELATAA